MLKKHDFLLISGNPGIPIVLDSPGIGRILMIFLIIIKNWKKSLIFIKN